MSERDPRFDALGWLAIYRDLGVGEFDVRARATSPAPPAAPAAPEETEMREPTTTAPVAARAARTREAAPAPRAAAPTGDAAATRSRAPRAAAAAATPAAEVLATNAADAATNAADAAAIAAILEAERGRPEAALERLRGEVIGDCRRCRLCEGRTKLVFGVGDPHARLMFVGEGPGADEDLKGEPFVGRAGQLLDKIIAAMGLSRPQVYIGNIVKCRPPNNRTPLPDERAACIGFLKAQIRAIKPEILVALGKTAVEGLTGLELPGITRVRGTWYEFEGVPLKVTFHPAYLLRNPPAKRPVWEDMQDVMRRLGLSPPKPRD